MFDKPQANQVLGLDIDNDSLKGVVLSSQRGTVKADTFFTFPIEIAPLKLANSNESHKSLNTPTTEQPQVESAHVKPLYNDQQEKQLESLTKKNLAVTSLHTQHVLARPLELKIKKTKDIDAVLAFQAEPILPYPIENAVLDRIILNQDKEGSHLTLTASRKNFVSQHLSLWNSLDIDPEIISAAPFALSLFAKTFINHEEPFYVLNLGVTHIFCILVDKGKLIAAQAIPGDLLKIIDAIAQNNQTSPATVKAQIDSYELQIPALNEGSQVKGAVDEMRIAVTRTIYALDKQTKGRNISSILITGPGANISGLSDELCHSLNKNLLSLQPAQSFGMSIADRNAYALPIGSALSALPVSKDQINFRQNDFAYPAPWKRLKRPMITYFALCIGLALALILYSKASTLRREAEIKKQYLELLNVMNKPYAEFEKEYSSKISGPQDVPVVTEIAALTPNEIKGRLHYLEKEIQATPQTYPLLPNVPLVSDVLAWISTHPTFIGTRSEDDKAEPSLQIESFNYTLVKRPEPTKKHERYQVKVELEFSSPTPKRAREFHDALIAPNEIVDPKGEIKWNSNRDKYRTSFYLKDKTIYPSLN